MAALLRPSVVGAVFGGESGYAFPNREFEKLEATYVLCLERRNIWFHSCCLAEKVIVTYGFFPSVIIL